MPKGSPASSAIDTFPEGSSTLNELEKSITSPNSVSLFTSDAGKITSHLVGFIPVTSGAEVVYAVFGDKTVLVSGVDPSC